MLKLRNERTGQLEPFEPLEPGKATVYVCGITPYDTTHLGHAFTYLSYDVLIRYLEYRGYAVRYVQNVTDIDDDVLRKGHETREDWFELGNRWTRRFLEDLRDLNVRTPDVLPRATETIPDMFAPIQAMIDAGKAYVAAGNVYYSVASYGDFGEISGLPEAEWLSTANERGNHPDDPHKRDPLDFVLWQATVPGEPSWQSPWGAGRPGWHIECSTMVSKYLGEQIDLHGGGADLTFPHHECESAQARTVNGKTFFVRYWLHTAMVRYNGEKMAKSLGNLVWVRDLIDEYSADAVRALVHAHNYDETWEYRAEESQAANTLAKKLRRAAWRESGTGTPYQAEDAVQAFLAALENNLDSASALTVLECLSDDILAQIASGADVSAAQKTLRSAAGILGMRLGTEADAEQTRVWDALIKRFE
ncbi:MAG: cysteine--tRNA ligase [Chloroflexi bacterium]|nr:cysteine--tRNA ligase [Chloroflexota bacterium]